MYNKHMLFFIKNQAADGVEPCFRYVYRSKAYEIKLCDCT